MGNGLLDHLWCEFFSPIFNPPNLAQIGSFGVLRVKIGPAGCTLIHEHKNKQINKIPLEVEHVWYMPWKTRNPIFATT